MQGCYDEDFYQWLLAQAALLKKRRFDLLDIDQLAEEIELLARAEVREVHGYVRQILIHLVIAKAQGESGLRDGHDESFGQIQHRLHLVLSDSPSLRIRLPQIIEEAWTDAREELEQRSTAECLYTFHLPSHCPFDSLRICGE